MDFRFVASNAAKEAGKLLADSFNTDVTAEGKGAHDVVSEIDRTSEQKIIAIIKTSFPDHTIVVEESGKSVTNSEYALEHANQRNQNGHAVEEWWKTAIYLEPYEREAMAAFHGLQSLGDLAEKMRVTENQLLLFIRSAIAKHRNTDKQGNYRHD